MDKLLLKPETPFLVHLQALSQTVVAAKLGRNVLIGIQNRTRIVLVPVMRLRKLNYVLNCRARHQVAKFKNEQQTANVK
jgi:hypothetical protein